MKSPKLAFWTALALTGMSGTLHADYLANSFETSPVVYGASASPPYSSVGQSSLWATEGTSSLTTSFDNSYTWSWLYSADSAGQNYYNPTTYLNWYNHNKLQIDIYRPASNPSGNLELVLATSGPEGWQQQQVVNWEWQNTGTDVYQTLTWDYSAIRNAAPAPSPGYVDWWQFAFMARGGSGGTVFIDNVRFVDQVPEPTVLSMLLLGLPAGLALRARRAAKS